MGTIYRRFAFKAHGLRNYYIACDLNEGLLRCWPSSSEQRDADNVFQAANLDERLVWLRKIVKDAESDYCTGVVLSASDVSYLEKYLTVEVVDEMRRINNEYMFAKTNGWCYRDGWSLDFYAESDDGLASLSLKDIRYCSFHGDEEAFESIEDYINWNLLGCQGASCIYVEGGKLPGNKARAVASAALSAGLSAVEELLWHAHPRIIKALDEVPCDKPLCYRLSDDSFTVKYGREISRACKLFEKPRCAEVFGSEHTFCAPDNM